MDLEAVIVGPPDSPFEKGFFKLKIHLPERYPFEPPQGELILVHCSSHNLYSVVGL